MHPEERHHRLELAAHLVQSLQNLLIQRVVDGERSEHIPERGDAPTRALAEAPRIFADASRPHRVAARIEAYLLPNLEALREANLAPVDQPELLSLPAASWGGGGGGSGQRSFGEPGEWGGGGSGALFVRAGGAGRMTGLP